MADQQITQSPASTSDTSAKTCSAKTEVYSRVCGFFRPVQSWNSGKKAEFKERVTYAVERSEAKRT